MSLAVSFLILSAALAADTTRLQCRVVDDGTGKPIAARVYVRDASGKWHFVKTAAPQGSAVVYDKQRFEDSVERHTTVSADPFTVDVPSGKVTLRVERGKEYLPQETDLDAAGGEQQVVVRLRRWIDMASAGWYSGDTHVHRSLDELPNLLLAEDLNVALPLTYWVTAAYQQPDRGETARQLARFGGKTSDIALAPRPIPVDETHVIYPINTEYEIFTVDGKRHTLGAVFALGHREPFDFGVPPVTRFAAEARRQGGILDLDKHSWPWSLMLVPVAEVELFELANNHCWRTEFGFRQWTADIVPEYMRIERDERGLTEWGWHDFTWQTYYALLNAGFPMRPSAGTASGVHPVPLGFGRVYVHLPEGFSYRGWMEGLAAGRSFVSTGPMLKLTFQGADPGATLQLDELQGSCRIRGVAVSARPLQEIEIIEFGRVVRRAPAENRLLPGGGYESPVDVQAPLEKGTWLAVRVREDREDGRVRFAHTAPVHVRSSRGRRRPRRVESDYLESRMEQEIERNRGVLTPAALAEYERALELFRGRR